MHRIEDRHTLCPFSAFAGAHTADNLRAVIDHQTGLEAAFTSGNALYDDFGVLIGNNRHD